MDASVIASWIMKDENGDFAMDEDGKLLIDEEAIGKTVERWAEKHDSVGGPWTFHPTRGGTVTIEKGTYGYKLDQKKQKEYYQLTFKTTTNSKKYSQKRESNP